MGIETANIAAHAAAVLFVVLNLCIGRRCVCEQETLVSYDTKLQLDKAHTARVVFDIGERRRAPTANVFDIDARALPLRVFLLGSVLGRGTTAQVARSKSVGCLPKLIREKAGRPRVTGRGGVFRRRLLEFRYTHPYPWP